MAHKKSWNELSKSERTALLVLASIELALTATALVDLARRPADQVRGAKALWAMAVFVQPIGPIAYLTGGRKRVTA